MPGLKLFRGGLGGSYKKTARASDGNHTVGFKSQSIVDTRQTFLKADTGAISAPFKVRSRNMGQDEAFIRNPEGENIQAKMRLMPHISTA